jgi:hypothetical protein
MIDGPPDGPGTCPALEPRPDGDFVECGAPLPCAGHGTYLTAGGAVRVGRDGPPGPPFVFDDLAGDLPVGEARPVGPAGTWSTRWDVARPYVFGLLAAVVARVLAEVAAAGHVFVSALLISLAIVGAKWWGGKRVARAVLRQVEEIRADRERWSS